MGTEFFRYVALGDSQTEGLNDGSEQSGYRGWADRFAESLARSTSPELRYANLAVRASRARHVRRIQLPAALALKPDLATVVVGMNDLFRHDYDLDATVADVETVFAELRAAGCRVATMSFPDVARVLPVLSWLRARQIELNARLVEAAARHDVAVLDLFPLVLSDDPLMWSHDRIHGSVFGHTRIAAGMAHLFGLPGSDPSWAVPLGEPRRSRLDVVRRDTRWIATFLVPFVTKQLVGRGADVHADPKRPEMLPVLVPQGVTPNGDGRPTLAGGAAVE
jgi:lysophospholipase L1-like esterase